MCFVNGKIGGSMQFDKKIFLENIEKIIKERCNNKKKIFNKAIGQRDAATRWQKETEVPSFKAIIKICEVYDVDIGWLLTGKGEMTKTKNVLPFDYAVKLADDIIAEAPIEFNAAQREGLIQILRDELAKRDGEIRGKAKSWLAVMAGGKK